MKQNDIDQKNGSSHREQIAEQPKLADREYFGRRPKSGIRPIFLSNDPSQPKKKYTTKEIKPHETIKINFSSLLTNISYNRVKEEDLFDRSFVIDFYVLTTKNVDPLSIEKKIFDAKKREMIHMFREECNELSFHKHIWNPDNFMYLNVKDVIYWHVAEIFWKYLETDKKDFVDIKKKLIKNRKRFQFFYSSTYPDVYSFVEKWGVELRNNENS